MKDKWFITQVDTATFLEFWKLKEEQAGRTIADAMQELRALCEEEEYAFAWQMREDRFNPFV